MNSTLRLLLSGAVASCFYFSWAYWANNSPNIDPAVTLNSALVQGIYSGGVTLFFTLLLEKTHKIFVHRCLSLAFMVPVLCAVYSPTRQATAMRSAMNNALDLSAKKLAGYYLPGVVFAPLLPILVQSVLVVLTSQIIHPRFG